LAFLNNKLKEVDSRTLQSLTGMKKELEILMSIPGIGFTTAAGILAEIGNITVFPKPKNLVSWSGLAPGVNESAGKSSNSHITKEAINIFERFLFWQQTRLRLENQTSFGFLPENSGKKRTEEGYSCPCQEACMYRSSSAHKTMRNILRKK